MVSPDGLIITAGGISLAGNWHNQGGWPSNGVTIVAATLILTIIFSTSKGTKLQGPATALAGLMVLTAVYAYVPAFRTPVHTKKKVGKK